METKNDDFLKKRALHPLTPDEKEEQEIGGPFSMLSYKLALCSKGDGSPICVRYSEYTIPTKGKVLHIICPSAKEGCGQPLLYPELETPPECAQKKVKNVVISEELHLSEMIKKTSQEYVKKFNKLIKKLPFRKRF